jgi:hypothetical protein
MNGGYRIYFECLDSIIQGKNELCEILEEYKKTYYEYIQVSTFDIIGEPKVIKQWTIRRTEFSKIKYITVYSIPMTSFGLYLPFHASKEDFEYDDEEYVEVNHREITYEEFITKLEKYISSLEEIIDINKHYYNNLKAIEVPEIEPIAPKGNPYAGESWKDKKHKFKGGKRKWEK